MARKKSKRGKGQRSGKKKHGARKKSSDSGQRPAESTALSRLGRGKGGGFRVPAIVMIPVCAGVVWVITGGWPGGVIGGVIGFFLWRMRA